MIHRLVILLTMIAAQSSPRNAYAQELQRVVDWFGATATATAVQQHSVEIPDSVRQKVGYQHWKGAAIGGGVGAVAGLVLALFPHVGCSDCESNDPGIAATSLAGAGLGGAFGFLVGLASPKYEWVPSPAVQESSGR